MRIVRKAARQLPNPASQSVVGPLPGCGAREAFAPRSGIVNARLLTLLAVDAPRKLDSGDTAWMLTSTGLVLLMVPGLALFYGGMVRRKNVLGTMMHSMVALGLIGIQWLLFGY